MQGTFLILHFATNNYKYLHITSQQCIIYTQPLAFTISHFDILKFQDLNFLVNNESDPWYVCDDYKAMIEIDECK